MAAVIILCGYLASSSMEYKKKKKNWYENEFKVVTKVYEIMNKYDEKENMVSSAMRFLCPKSVYIKTCTEN
jgi:hypothetical protein